MKAGHSFLNNKMAYISERRGKGNRLPMFPFQKSRKNKKGDFQFYKSALRAQIFYFPIDTDLRL
nr:MAG TPA: hypothetical protein [Caudoviricetes sp.]